MYGILNITLHDRLCTKGLKVSDKVLLCVPEYVDVYKKKLSHNIRQ